MNGWQIVPIRRKKKPVRRNTLFKMGKIVNLLLFFIVRFNKI